MGLLDDFFSTIDSAKRTAKRGLLAVADDPAGALQTALARYMQENVPTPTDAQDAQSVMPGMGDALQQKMEGLGLLGMGGTKTVSAPKAIDAASRFLSGDKAGTYRGSEAFGGISPQKLGSMRKGYLDKMETGAPGKYWYDNSSGDILRLTGGDTEGADNLANMLAVTSSRTPVASNFMYGVKGWNQNAVGDPIKTGGFPNAMGQDITEMLASPEATATGLKRSPFSAGLSVAWRGPDFANRPTHDIHDVRAWGISDPKTGKPWSKGVGEAGHRFLDDQGAWVTDEANRVGLAGASDWTPYRSQAAAWIAQKAAKEGISIEEAAKHYGTAIPDYSAQVTREWTPGDNTEHLTGLLGNQDMQRAFADAVEPAVRGAQGQDRVAQALGALSDRTLPNAGIYEGAQAPGFASQIPVGKRTGAQVADASSSSLMDAIASAHGLFGAQKQSAWNYLGGPEAIKRAGAWRINTGAPMDEATLRALQGDVGAIGGDIAQVDPRGARGLIFDDPGAASRGPFAKALQGLAQKYGGDASFNARSGNLIPMQAPPAWSAKPYVEGIEAAGPKVVDAFNQNAPAIAQDVMQRVGSFAAKNGLTQAPWYQPMMEGIANGGLPELKRLIAAGTVPVAVLTLLPPDPEAGL